MPQQGQYPLNGRTLSGGDTVTGVVTGSTADIPLAVIYSFCLSGTTANRPVPLSVGQPYFDTTLGFMIWVKQISPPIWVAASGVQV